MDERKKILVRRSLSGLLFLICLVHFMAAVYYWVYGGHTWERGPIKIRIHQWEKPWLIAIGLWLIYVLIRTGPLVPARWLAYPFDPWTRADKRSVVRPWSVFGATVGAAVGAYLYVSYYYLMPSLLYALPVMSALAALSGTLHGCYASTLDQILQKAAPGIPFDQRAGVRTGLYAFFWFVLCLGPLRVWQGRYFDPLFPAIAGFMMFLVLAAIVTAPGRAGFAPRKFRVPVIIAVIIFLAALVLWSHLSYLRSLHPERAPRFRVIVVTLDTTRPDRLGAYGYERRTSPNLDAVAERGARFEKSICVMGGTDMSHASIFTGSYPRTHGLINTGLPITGPVGSLPEYFQERGFATAAIISRARLDPARIMHLPGFDDQSLPHRTGHEATAPHVFRRTANWLSAHRDQDVFVWVHFFDPHMDYEPHPELETRLADSDQSCHADARLKPDQSYDEAEVERCSDLYDEEIAYMDFWLGRLLEWIDELEPKSEYPPLIVLIGDHGEALGEYQDRPEHFGFGHGGILYEGVIRIPFIISWPGVIPKGVVVPELAETVDLAPTLVSYVFDQNAFTEHGGQNLRPMIEGDAAGDDIGFVQRWRSESFPDRPELAEQWYAVYKQNWKLMIRPADGKARLYDLAPDPHEFLDLAEVLEEKVDELNSELLEWLKRTPETKPAASEVDRAGWKLLKDLGYVQ